MRNRFIFLLLFVMPMWLVGQYSGIVHYTVKDGLPSSTTYYTIQDRKGFIWISTDAGLVRFDGAKFNVYTTGDGVPDNEVLGLHFDAKTDRIWIITYSKQACYYRDGKFYTAKNDSSLKMVKCDFGEFLNANVQKNAIEFLFNASSIYEFESDRIKKISTNGPAVFQVKKWNDSVYDILAYSGMIAMTNGKVTGKYNLDIVGRGKWIDSIYVEYHLGRAVFYKKLSSGQYHLENQVNLNDEDATVGDVMSVGDKFLISIWQKGLYSIDADFSTPLKQIWKGSVNGFNEDKDGNIWITTTDDGVYVLKKQSVTNYDHDNGLVHDNVTSLWYSEPSGPLYFGNTYGEIFQVDGDSIKSIDLRFKASMEKIRGITTVKSNLFAISNSLIASYDLKSHSNVDIYHLSGGPKSILKLADGKTLLIGLLGSIVKYDIPSGLSNEFKFSKRILTMAQDSTGTIYCGSLDGIYVLKNDKLVHLANDDPRLQSRIASLCFNPDGVLWIGTPSNGIFAFDGKKIIGHINASEYVSYRGAICRQVVANKSNEIWIATNLGIDKIRYHLHDSVIIDNITPLNTMDGLLSDDVNDIALHDSLIYVATSRGLTILNENKLLNPPAAPIYINSVRINDKDSAIHDDYRLEYWQNNLKIEYVGILLPSANYIRYQYRLLGSGNDKWTATTNTSIEFRSLSSGDYTFEVAVLDKFGNSSKHLARVHFYIRPAFYQTIWFWSLIFIIVLSISFVIIRSIFERRKRQYEKEQSYNTKIIDLEQQALKAQMNPHFIFNCLTAIQHFVNKEDVYSANMYLSNFAKLIRKTLDLSGEQYITLDKEVSYLENYIQLEKMRFQEQFNYIIEVDLDVDPFNALIPPMLLQPIIENAIRHGLRYKDNNEGMLKINFSKDGESLMCRIDDNGIGIKRSRELKSSSHVEYQSKGMKLTESRITAINMMSEQKISMEVKDKYDSEGNAMGTVVVLKFMQ